MTKEEIIAEVGKPILRPLGILPGLFILAVIASPFIWIWIGWGIAWKVGLSGLIGTLVFYGIYNVAKKVVTEEVEKELNNTTLGKSKFQKRLEELQNK